MEITSVPSTDSFSTKLFYFLSPKNIWLLFEQLMKNLAPFSSPNMPQLEIIRAAMLSFPAQPECEQRGWDFSRVVLTTEKVGIKCKPRL